MHQWWGNSESLGNITVIECRRGAPDHTCNNADEFCELVRVLGSTAHRKHVVGQVKDVVPQPVVRTKECFDILPRCSRLCSYERQYTHQQNRSCDSQFCVCSRASLCPGMPTISH